MLLLPLAVKYKNSARIEPTFELLSNAFKQKNNEKVQNPIFEHQF